MKKYVLILLIALALLAIPPAAMAAETEISGTISRSIEVTVTPAALVLDMSNAGYTPVKTATVHVVATGPISSWAVTARDLKTTGYVGYMTKDGANLQPLSEALQLSLDGSTWTNLVDPTVVGIIGGSGPTTGTDQVVSFKQLVSTTDPSGDYKITVLFTGAYA